MASIKYYVVLVLMAFIAVSQASVAWLRIRRDIDHNRLESVPATQASNQKIFCDPLTPCGWHVYSPYDKKAEYFIENTYCSCSAELSCVQAADDTNTGAYVHYCRKEKPESLAT